MLAADVDQRIHRTATAQNTALRYAHRPIVHMGFGIALIGPDQLADNFRKSGRHADEDPFVFWPGLQQQNARRGSFRQQTGNHATGRTTADHNVVVPFILFHALSVQMRVENLRWKKKYIF
ncbi:hypothetical protein D3C72_1874810 [compost metagenome]